MKTNDYAEERNAGLGVVLALLVAFHVTGKPAVVTAALIVLVAALAVPMVFRPLSRIFPVILRFAMEKIATVFLALAFYLLVAPMAVARRALKKDPLQLSGWRSGSGSLFTDRNHRYVAADLENPY